MQRARDTAARSTLGTLWTQLLVYVVAVVTSVLVARVLGPGDRGVYAFLCLPAALFAPLAMFGFGHATIYLISSRQYQIQDVLCTCILVGFLHGALGACFFGFLWGLGLFDRMADEIPAAMVIAMLMLLPLHSSRLMMTRLLLGDSWFAINNRVDLAIRMVLSALLIATVVVCGFGLVGVVLSMALAAVVAFLGLLWGTFRHYRPRLTINTHFLRHGYSYGMRGWIGDLAHGANLRADQLLLSMFATKESLGNYAIATLVAELLWMLPSSLGVVLFNRISSQTSKIEQVAITARAHRVLLAVTAGLSVLLAIGGFWLIPLLFGERYDAAPWLLALLLPGTVALTSLKLLTKYFSGRGMPEKSSFSLGAAAVLGVGLYITLIPVYGVLGAALASSIGYSCASLVGVWLYLRDAAPERSRLLLMRRADALWVLRQVVTGLRRTDIKASS